MMFFTAMGSEPKRPAKPYTSVDPLPKQSRNQSVLRN